MAVRQGRTGAFKERQGGQRNGESKVLEARRDRIIVRERGGCGDGDYYMTCRRKESFSEGKER